MKNNRLIFKIAAVKAALFAILFISVGFCNPYFRVSISQTNVWVAPPEADKIKNPVISNAKSIAAGKALYSIYCVPCHGEKGKGDGPASLSIKTKPADHTNSKIQNQSDGAIFWKLTEGRATLEMVSYKFVLSDTDRWSLVNFIRTLGAK